MKKILITGAGSFIGTSFENYIKNHTNHAEYEMSVMDTLTGKLVGGESEDIWNFSGFDTVFHVAGIAHADVGKVTEEGKELYRKVNTELAIDTAEKAKAAGVKQFIFMSSAIVYGASSPIGKEKIITKDTKPEPENFYGESKLNAETGLLKLMGNEDENKFNAETGLSELSDGDTQANRNQTEVADSPGKPFKVVILRPPMIYGPGCKGNYNSLRKFALKFPVFPKVANERSMLYIDNLCEFVRLMINHEENGIFHPANAEISNTSEMVRLIADAHGKKIGMIGGFTWLLKIMSHFTGLVNKAFGNLTYSDELTKYKENYRVYTLEESIKKTEN